MTNYLEELGKNVEAVASWCRAQAGRRAELRHSPQFGDVLCLQVLDHTGSRKCVWASDDETSEDTVAGAYACAVDWIQTTQTLR